MAVPNRVRERISANLKRLAPILLQQKARDVSEADTVTLVKDLLSDVFGFDKYSELTSEFAIRGTFCDLAIKIEDKLVQLVEVKAIGISLDDRHVKQAVDYAANQGVEWVVLTNGIGWRLYHVVFSKPIDKRLIIELDLSNMEAKKDDDLEKLFLFTKEGFKKGAHIELRDKQDATSRYMLAALLLNNENVVGAIRRELRRVVDVLAEDDELIRVLRDEVIKRDAMEGPAAEEAMRRVAKAGGRSIVTRAKPEIQSEEAASSPVSGEQPTPISPSPSDPPPPQATA